MSYYNIIESMSEEISKLYDIPSEDITTYALGKMANTEPKLSGEELIDLGNAYNIFAIEAGTKYKGTKIADKYRTYSTKEEFYKLAVEPRLKELKEYSDNKQETSVETSPTESNHQDPVQIHGNIDKSTENIIDVPQSIKTVKVESVKFNNQSNIKPGGEINLNRANLYKKLDDKIPSRSLTGKYYLCTGNNVKGRYALVAKPEFAKDPRFIIGFINISDI